MTEFIKPGSAYSEEICFIAVNKNEKNCQVIKAGNDIKIDKIIDKIDDKFPEFKVKEVNAFSTGEVIQLFWPQIVHDLTQKFSFAESWLKRAVLEVKNKQLEIKLESHLAFKKLNSPQVKSYIENKITYYSKIDFDIIFSNGNFIKDIKQENITAKKFKRKKEDRKKAENKSDNINRTENSNKKDNSSINPENNISESSIEVLYGKTVKKDVTDKISEITSPKKRAIIEGEVFEFDKIPTKGGNFLFILKITDKTNSISGKIFMNNNQKADKFDLQKGDWIKTRGNIIDDDYNNELVIQINDINRIEPPQREDKAEEKRVELHLHTQMSAMDSTINVKEVIERASEWGHSSLAITDHGIVQSYPDAYEAGKENDIKIIYGLEAYLVDDGEPIVSNPGNKNLNKATYVVFDLETTGLNPQKDEIIEIGAVKFKEGEIIDEFSSFIKPKSKIPQKITKITGITEDMVSEAPSQNKVLSQFYDFIGDNVLVAHNAGFDYGFLRSHLLHCNLTLKNYSVLDTLGLSRALCSDLKNHKLDTLADHFNINLENHHRALDDTKATLEIFRNLIDKCRRKEIVKLKEINDLSRDIDWRNLPVHHTVILARNQKGLKQLYKLISNSHLKHFYRKPRILKSEIIHYKKNLLIGSACEAGQLFKALIENKSENEIKELIKFYDYLEIQPLANNQFLIPDKVESKERLKEINAKIYDLGQKYNKPVVATCDSHFINPEDEIYRKILQVGQGYEDAEKQPPLYFRTTEEMLEEFSYFEPEKAEEIVIKNPQKIADTIEDDIKPIPEKLFTPEIADADQDIREKTYHKAKKMYGNPLPDLIENRLEKELSSIIENGYSVIYLISHKLVRQSLDDGYLVGSRGSVGSSLVAFFCDITEVNPLSPHYRCSNCQKSEFEVNKKAGVGNDLPDKNCPDCGEKYKKEGFEIPFEVFLGFKGDKVPDIDLNFSGEYQDQIHEFTEEVFGRDYVYRAGTISTIAKRTAYGFVKGYLDEKDIDCRSAEVDRLVEGCTGVRRTTGQHPGGLMVVPRDKDINDFTPVQHPANDQDTDVRTTHFDYHSIEGRILKLDLLGHDNPTTLRMLQDMTGVNPENIPLDDPETMKIFSGTDSIGVKPDEINSEVGTFGIPEFGTDFVRQMLVDTKPTTFADLVRISGLSHGTDVWLNNAQDLVKKGKSLSEVISVRDDIMNYLLEKDLEPENAFWIMEHVRKGKGLTEKEEKAMRKNGVPDWYIESCKTIKYMFPKAHAAAYVTMAFRIAYFKVHYPPEFYTTFFTTNADDFDAQIVVRGLDYIIDKKNELENKKNKTAKDNNTISILEVVIEAILRGVKFKNVDLYKSDADQFKLEGANNLIPPLICLQGLGKKAAQKIISSRKNDDFTSIEELVDRTGISKTVIEVMKEHGTIANLPESNQLSLF